MTQQSAGQWASASASQHIRIDSGCFLSIWSRPQQLRLYSGCWWTVSLSLLLPLKTSKLITNKTSAAVLLPETVTLLKETNYIAPESWKVERLDNLLMQKIQHSFCCFCTDSESESGWISWWENETNGLWRSILFTDRSIRHHLGLLWSIPSCRFCSQMQQLRGGFNLGKSMMSWVEYSSPASCCHLHKLSAVHHTSFVIRHICADTQLWWTITRWKADIEAILNNQSPTPPPPPPRSPPPPPPPPHWEGSASHRRHLFTSTHLSSVGVRASSSHDAHAHGMAIRLDGCF